MFLSRLRIRGKLILLVIIPLLAMIALVVPVIRSLADDVEQANAIDSVTTVARRVGPLLEDVQRERLLSVGYLLEVVSEDDLALQTATVTDRVREVQRDLGDRLTPELRDEINRVNGLEDVRKRVRDGSVQPDIVIAEFDLVLDSIIDSLPIDDDADAGTETGRQLIALDALFRIDEAANDGVLLLAMMAAGGVNRYAVEYREGTTRLRTYSERFADYATPAQQELFGLVSAAFQDRLGEDFDARFADNPSAAMARLPLADLFPKLRSFSVLGGFAKKRVVDDVTAAVTDQRQQQLTVAYGTGLLVIVILLVVLALVATVARAVAVPLTRLGRAAERVAEAGETELRRIADDEAETIEPVRLEVLDLDAQDEIGDLARVFARVQQTASQLVERQVLSRRNVAEMFGHIGRRTQNLVGGQVDLIDELENAETDPDRLAKLYRLDHIANRLRRSADSLVVISGAEREASHSSPVRLIDVARLALAEIEDYTRVDVDVPLDLLVAPSLVSDLVLICGELLENATVFSPPHTRVTVSARAVPGGARLSIADHGIGMLDDRLAEENARIARRERLDLVPTQVLGLFVVGRLARRHGMNVTLAHTPGGGVTVQVTIGSVLLAGDMLVGEPVAGRAPGTQRPVPVETPVRRGDGPERSSVREAISRVSDVMSDPVTWNGFDVARQLPSAPPPLVAAPPPAPQVVMPPPSPMVAVPPPSPMVAAPPPAPVHAPEPAPASPPVSSGGLRRRVPGAQLAPAEPPPMVAHPVSGPDPEAARLLVEQLELGVSQALHESSTHPRQ